MRADPQPPDRNGVTDLRDAMVDMLLHDVRSPLSVASGMVESVLRHWDVMDGPRRRQLLARAARAHTQIGEVLDRLAEVEQQHVIVLDPQHMRVLDVVQDAVEKSVLDPARLTVQVTPRDLTVVADAFALERVMINLLDNVAHHTLDPSPAAVYARVEDGQAVIEVRSTKGPGAGTNGRRDGTTGTLLPGVRLAGHGIGLVLAARFTESMGGELDIQEHTNGVVVHVRLSLAEDDDCNVTDS